jgi:DNA-binding NarL/FixJ family response regulator
MTTRILIADDQELVRTALRTLVERGHDLQVAGEAADGEQAVAAAFAGKPDVVLMDVRMPGLTGVEATERILRDWPHPEPRPRILVLTTFDLDEYVHAALRAGASGFILKNSSIEEMTAAIRVVAAGGAMLAPTVTQRLIQTFASLPPPLVGASVDLAGTLTPRELEVLSLVGKGHSNAEIAARLGLSQANVKSRVNRILSKLGLENRVQAALLVHSSDRLDQG